MRLDEALRESVQGKAKSNYNRIARLLPGGQVECQRLDGSWRQLFIGDLEETWVPYHDPPKEPKIVCVHFCSPDHGPATRLYEHPGPPCPIPNDPPKEKRLREWWVCHNIKSPQYQPVALSTPPLGGGDADDGFTRVREVSPERDEIVRAAVAWMRWWKPIYGNEPGVHIPLQVVAVLNAVEAWERAGRPA